MSAGEAAGEARRLTAPSAPAPPRPVPVALARAFRLIAFDWDGTAVMSRDEDVSDLLVPLEALLRDGVPIVVVTGTNFGNLDRQLASRIHGAHKQNLYVATDRGSVVHGFDARSEPVVLSSRVATPHENALLTATADTVRDELTKKTKLDIRVIENRLNRRKIDLIPLPEWADPPKWALPRLLEAVERRLEGAGFTGGLAGVVTLAERTAAALGLEARVTSDVKHVEVGLTDKGDSIAWAIENLVARRGIATTDLVILGDEWGPLGGVDGSDHKMAIPAARGAVLVSVGPEPGGVPPEVIHVPGGPDRFLEILTDQVDRQAARPEPRRIAAPLELQAEPTKERDWLLVDEGIDWAREHEFEATFAIANGYLGARASLAEGSFLSSPGTFVAGVFAIRPQALQVPELLVLPDWSRIRAVIAGPEIRLETGRILEHRRTLDLRQAILWREWRHDDGSGRTSSVGGLRLASLADRHVLFQSAIMTPENFVGAVVVETAIDRPRHEQQMHGARREVVPVGARSAALFTAVTVGTGVTVALAALTRITGEDLPDLGPEVEAVSEDRLVECWRFEAHIGRRYRLDRVVTVFTSRDTSDPGAAAIEHLRSLADRPVERLVQAHVRAWAARWEECDIEVEGDDEARRALRFAGYHLSAAVLPGDPRVSIGARALTGESYQGHVFWDTEIFMLPFFTLTDPVAARTLLLFRHRTLDGARRKARAHGYVGAQFPWESADGEEATPPFAIAPNGAVLRVLCGDYEDHISADIAFAVARYVEATGDDDFLRDAGAELVLETARFWASRVTLEAGVYHIRGVIGPDEYHELVDDNAYTNVMAQANLEQGVAVARLLDARWPEAARALRERLALSEVEVERWGEIARALYTGFDPATGLFEQFRGYYGLEEIDLTQYGTRSAPMDVILGRDRIQRSKVVKQADVVLLMALLRDRFTPEVRAANFRYYEPRTSHGSSLSPPIHALVAAGLGDRETACRYFRQTAEIDLANNMGNASGGVHAGALGGLWQAAVLGFGGVAPRDGRLELDPVLPAGWRALRFRLTWRGRRLRAAVEQRANDLELSLSLAAGERGPIEVGVAGGRPVLVTPGRGFVTRRGACGFSPWEETAT